MHFVRGIAELLAQHGLIKGKDTEKARSLILSALEEHISKTNTYIQEFIKACSSRELAETEALIAC